MLLTASRLGRVATVRCRNESSTTTNSTTATDPKKAVFRKWETKVSNRVKENMNKLTVIGAVDFKLMYEIIKEVDEFHKKSMHDMMNKTKKDDVVHSQPDHEDSKDENIFLDA